MSDETTQPDIPAERLAAGRARLAAWIGEHSMSAKHGEVDVSGYKVGALDEWLVFSSPTRSNHVYLVAGDVVYSYAPSLQTLADAVVAARDETRRTAS